MSSENRRVFNKIFFVTILSGALILFSNNSENEDPQLKEFKIGLLRLSAKIKNSEDRPKLRKKYRAIRASLVNKIASTYRLNSCEELRGVSRAVPSGAYLLYLQKNNVRPSLVSCIFNESGIDQTILMSPKDLKTRSVASELSELEQTVQIMSRVGATTKKSVGMLILPPMLVKQLPGSARCEATGPLKADANFGYDDKNVWVKNGCSGVFRIVTGDVFKMEGAVESSSKMLMGEVETFSLRKGSDLTVKGWACHRGDSHPVAVNIYANYFKKSKTLVSSQWAKFKSDASTSEKCKSPKGSHNFEIRIPQSLAQGRGTLLLNIEIASVKNNKLRVKELMPERGAYYLPEYRDR